jgi:hypothetical protein
MDQNGYIVCNTDHFSTWTVAELESTTEPQTTTQSGIPLYYVYLSAAAIAIVVVVAGVFAYKKRK